MKSTQDALAALDAGLLSLINEALAQPTTSYSSFNNIITGNAYQSLMLRDSVTAGFRKRDDSLFAGIPLPGQRFVDLGCNLGEKTRLAALAGATYAEGIEYEEFFVRIGGLVSTYNRTTNAVIRQGDVTKPGCLTADFDIGACFSAFVYVEQNLAEILSKLRRLFILETHALDDAWYDNYIRKIEPLMPHWVLYGFTDHGAGQVNSYRALLAFARDRETVELVAIHRSAALAPTHPDVRLLDVPNSRRAWSMWGDARRTKALFAQLRDTLGSMRSPTYQDVAALLAGAIPGLKEMCNAYNLPGTHFGTDRYWLQMFRGLVHYVENAGIRPDNPYLSFLRQLSASGSYDPGMVYELSDEQRATRRLAPRLERFLEVICRREITEPLLMYNPLSLPSLQPHGYAPDDAQLDEHVTFIDGGEYRVQFVDGNHRLAALWLSGGNICPILPVWTNVFGLRQQNYKVFSDATTQDFELERILARNVIAARSR